MVAEAELTELQQLVSQILSFRRRVQENEAQHLTKQVYRYASRSRRERPSDIWNGLCETYPNVGRIGELSDLLFDLLYLLDTSAEARQEFRHYVRDRGYEKG